jgi:hypothetical protein
MSSFKFNVVETKRFVNVGVRNCINGSDRSSQSPERTIANNTHAAACGKYMVAHRTVYAPRPSPKRDCEDNKFYLYTRSIPSKCPKSNKEAVLNFTIQVNEVPSSRELCF